MAEGCKDVYIPKVGESDSECVDPISGQCVILKINGQDISLSDYINDTEKTISNLVREVETLKSKING